MKEFSSGKKGAAIVMHQMFLIMMLCGIYGIGYNLSRHTDVRKVKNLKS